jgi:hypothetical protein
MENPETPKWYCFPLILRPIIFVWRFTVFRAPNRFTLASRHGSHDMITQRPAVSIAEIYDPTMGT